MGQVSLLQNLLMMYCWRYKLPSGLTQMMCVWTLASSSYRCLCATHFASAAPIGQTGECCEPGFLVSNLLICEHLEETPCALSCACREHKGDHKSSIDVDESSWVLDEDSDGSSDSWHSLMISLARPAVTSEEAIWKKGDGTIVFAFLQ